MIVVSDTSPILNLARIGRLQLLPSLYRQILIPSGVYQELVASQRDRFPAIDLVAATWLVVARAADRNLVRKFCEHLDQREAEAIVLAIERQADLLLVDEKARATDRPILDRRRSVRRSAP